MLPAGAARMKYRTFSISFLVGAFIECSMLAWFGAHVLGGQKDLMNDPRALRHAIAVSLGEPAGPPRTDAKTGTGFTEAAIVLLPLAALLMLGLWLPGPLHAVLERGAAIIGPRP